jgi:hypothetical protein
MPRLRRKTAYSITAHEPDGSPVWWVKSYKSGWTCHKSYVNAYTRRRAEKIAWAESGRGRTVTVERISRRHGKRMITCAWVYRPPPVLKTVVVVRRSCDEGPRLVPNA